MGILIGLLILCVIVTIGSPYFLTQQNIFNVLRQMSTNMIISSAMTIIMITGGIDLSPGAVAALASCVGTGIIVNNGVPIWLGIIIALLIGALVGLVNGYILATTPLPPFIITYSTMSICRGLAYIYTSAQTIRITDPAFVNLGIGFTFGIPNPVIFMVIIVAIVYVILNRTKLGRHMYAIGGNATAAEYAGINIKAIRVFMYVFSGVLAAFAGILITGRSYSALASTGDGAEMNAIAAVCLGGTSFAGGEGRISGTVIGAMIIAILSNGMNLLGINSFWQDVVKGIVIIIAVYVDLFRKKKK